MSLGRAARQMLAAFHIDIDIDIDIHWIHITADVGLCALSTDIRHPP